MNPFVYLFYFVILKLIYTYKWIELQFLKLLAPWLQRKGKELGAKVGFVFHCPGDPEWTEIDDAKALAKCSERYDSLVHFRINDNSFFTSVANHGTLGLGESYMDKVWDYMDSPEDVAELIKRVTESNLHDFYYNKVNKFLDWLELCAFNLQTKKRALHVGEQHYDLGNDLYELMLDPWLQYTCGYWKNADNLNQAQLDKMELVAKKLDLKPGMKVLDIGCGWGTLCKYLAQNYGVECVGVTISKEGAEYGQKINENLKVDIRYQDYRDVTEKFDRVVSVGCLEHVGSKNYREFMKIVHRVLKDDGIFLLHSIGANHKNIPRSDRWAHKYIFPNGSVPKPCNITKETYGLFIIEDWHNFGADYAKTLNAWRENFINNWGKIEKKYGENFYRMWMHYLSTSEGMFLSRRLQLWQIVLSKDGLQSGYRAAR